MHIKLLFHGIHVPLFTKRIINLLPEDIQIGHESGSPFLRDIFENMVNPNTANACTYNIGNHVIWCFCRCYKSMKVNPYIWVICPNSNSMNGQQRYIWAKSINTLIAGLNSMLSFYLRCYWHPMATKCCASVLYNTSVISVTLVNLEGQSKNDDRKTMIYIFKVNNLYKQCHLW